MAKKNTDKFMNNNESLPMSITHDYTTDQLLELRRCEEDIIYFAENYFFIINLDEGRQKIKLYEAQKEAILGVIHNKRTIVCASRQVGKLLDLDTPVPTPNGWTTMGLLKDGDKIFDWNGNITEVVKAHDITYSKQPYEILFSNGERIVAGEEHEWFTQSRSERKRGSIGSVKTTQQIKDSLIYGIKEPEPSHRIHIKHNVDYPTKNLDIDPYLLGYWLGDGTTSEPTITVGVSDIEEFKTNFEYIKNKRIHKYNSSASHTVRILKDENKIPFKHKLRKLQVLGNKHIPIEYLQSSKYQRLELLKGLMDTDGYCNTRGTCQFYTTLPIMKENVSELLNSLGIQHSVTSKIPKIKDKEYTRCYILTFKTQTPIFKLQRKLKRQKRILLKNTLRSRNEFIYIKSIEPVEQRPMRCITVDNPEQMYLVGKSFIPTHNTSLMTIVCLWYALFHDDYTIAILANKEDQAKEILERIKLGYEELPNWLKACVPTFTNENVKFDNGSKIFISTTSESGIRGKSVNLLFVDEFAHIQTQIVDGFFKSVMPTISSSKKAKIVLVSCVTKDTHLITDKGIIEMEEFVDDTKTGAYEIPEYNIQGKDMIRSGTTMFNSGESDVYKLVTQSTTLKASPVHKLFSCRNGIYGWNTMESLTNNDYVAVQYGNDVWGNGDDVSDFVPSVSKKIKNVFNPSVITKDIAYFIGLYISEGSVYKKIRNGNLTGGIMTLTCGDSLHSAITNIGLKYSLSKDGLHYSISCKNLIEFFEYLGFDLAKRAPQKIIPATLLKMSRENIIYLLRGIFDGDGSAVKGGRVNISSSSIKLIDQLRIILLNFGILCEYSSGTTPPTTKSKVSSVFYRLIMNGVNAQEYYRKIGFNFERKTKVLEDNYLNKSTIINFLDTIPHVCDLFAADFKRVKKRVLTKGIVNAFYENKNLSRHHLLNFKSDHGFSDELLSTIVDKNIRWEKIKSNVIVGKERVYDFSLPNKNGYDPFDWNHSVIYNGILGHQTPKGAMGKFYEIWAGALKSNNGWHPVRIHYSDVPGRDEAWVKENLAAINYDMDTWKQEYEIEFLENGTAAINQQVIDKLKTMCVPAEFSFDDGVYYIWRNPEPGKIYSIGVDISEGVGQDYTVAQVLDITDPLDIHHCATFATNKIQPWVFAEKLNQIARSWGRPFLCIERNKEGGTVIDALLQVHNYDNIVNYNMQNDKRGVYQSPGIFCHQNSKYSGIQNLKYYIETKQTVSIYDLTTVQEFESFTRKENKTWAAKKGYHDDRVMAMVWALVILKKDIAERYLDVEEYDEAGSPVKISDPNQYLSDSYFKNGLRDNRPIRDIGGGNVFTAIFDFGNERTVKVNSNYPVHVADGGWNFL